MQCSGSVWELSGSALGDFWETSGRALGELSESSGRTLGEPSESSARAGGRRLNPRLRGRCTEIFRRLAKSVKIHAPLEIEGKTRRISAKFHDIFFEARRPCHATGFARARWESPGRALGELWESSGRVLGELWKSSGRVLRELSESPRSVARPPVPPSPQWNQKTP